MNGYSTISGELLGHFCLKLSKKCENSNTK